MSEDRVATANWPPSWTRATLELAVLALVCRAGPVHGYEVTRQLQAAGLGEVKGGTLYPVLGRLEEQNLLASEWVAGDGGPGRKLVTATTEGRRELRRRRGDWLTFTGRVAGLLTPEGPEPSQEEAIDDGHHRTRR